MNSGNELDKKVYRIQVKKKKSYNLLLFIHNNAVGFVLLHLKYFVHTVYIH